MFGMWLLSFFLSDAFGGRCRGGSRHGTGALLEYFILTIVFGLVPPIVYAQTSEAYRINRDAIELLRRGQLAEAVATAERAVKIADTNLGHDHPGLAAALTNLGETYVQFGRYADAERPLRRAVEIAESSWGIGPADLGAMLHNLGKLYALQGRYEDAEKLYLRALDLKDRIGKSHLAMATWLNSLVLLYIQQGRRAEAWTVAERGLVLLPDRSNRDPAVAKNFSLMGWLKLNEGQYEDAQRLTEWSLDIRQRVFGSDHPETAESIHRLGMVQEKRGSYKEAEPLLLRALAIRERTLPRDHADVGESLLDLAIHFYASGPPDRAQIYFKRAFDNLEARFDQYFTFMSEEDRLAFLTTVTDSFPVYYSFCLSHRDRFPELTRTMLDLVLWQKGMVAVSMRALLARMTSEPNPQGLKLITQLRERRTLIANLRDSGGAATDTISRLRQEANGLERELARISTSFAQRQRSARVRWDSVRNALGDMEAAVEYVAFDFHNGKARTGRRLYVALALKRGDSNPRLIPLGDSEKLLSTPLDDYRKQAGLERDPTIPDKPGFYEAFWQPLEQFLEPAKRVYVAPDGALNQVAWAVIHGPNQALLAEQVDLRLVSSTRDLVQNKGGPRSPTAVLLGDPDFGGTDGNAKFKPLPGTREEVAPIGRMLRKAGWRVELSEGREATEARLKAVRRPRVLHIATHGFFEPPAPGTSTGGDPMLRSGIALAGANLILQKNRNTDGEDGILTALEASTLDLQDTELVVLSACETGLGEVASGEGVFGLRRAFQEAGADAVLMSMWKVPDEETRALMTRFYDKLLRGLDKHRALREAQLELRREVKETWGRDRPLFWGAFVLVGR